MAVFHLVRHGQTCYDLAEERRLIGGMRDLVPLTGEGCRQAAVAAEHLMSLPIQAIVASPMTRAMQTAHIVAMRLRLPLAVEFDLHEWLPDLGCAYDTRDYVAQQTADLHQHDGEWPTGSRKTWEPLSRLRGRVMPVLSKYDHLQHVAVVAHGMVIYALTGQHVDNCAIVDYTLANNGR